MSDPALDRRAFHRLSSLGVGGMIVGSLGGCSSSQGGSDQAAPAELHVCRGLNTCKGKGKGGDNACAGQGACATIAAHDCAGHNACKGQGGCGSSVAENACKGQGGCAVPLMTSAWDTARKRLEERMKKEGKTLGAAPAAK